MVLVIVRVTKLSEPNPRLGSIFIDLIIARGSFVYQKCQQQFGTLHADQQHRAARLVYEITEPPAAGSSRSHQSDLLGP